jgi:prepilin-type N-terminal cleavage/methylation domain-containing protein
MSRTKKASESGFSLVEVLIALSIFSVIAAGFLSSALQARRMTQSNIYESTALIIATSYLEQVRDMEFGLLMECIKDPENNLLETEIDQGAADWLTANSTDWTVKSVVIDRDEYNMPKLKMKFKIRIALTDLNVTDSLDAIQTAVDFTWQSPDTHKWYEKSLRTVKANVI